MAPRSSPLRSRTILRGLQPKKTDQRNELAHQLGKWRQASVHKQEWNSVYFFIHTQFNSNTLLSSRIQQRLALCLFTFTGVTSQGSGGGLKLFNGYSESKFEFIGYLPSLSTKNIFFQHIHVTQDISCKTTRPNTRNVAFTQQLIT